MELALIVRELLTKRRWLAVGAVVAFGVAVLSVCQVRSILPPRLAAKDLQYSAASIQAYVDTPRSFVGDTTVDIGPGINRATVFANLMASPG
ncbi:MAG: hypothetical protein ACRDNS_21475, partial [Trebonia sp.]